MSGNFRPPQGPRISFGDHYHQSSFITGANDLRCWRVLKPQIYIHSIKLRIREEMSEGRETGKGVRQGCSLSPTIFHIYLEDLMENCFPNTGGVNIGGRRIKCIRFADVMALPTEDKGCCRTCLCS